jgi:DNA helicase-4
VDRIERTFDLEHWVTRRETRRLWEGRPTRSEIGFDLEALARDLDDYPDLAFGLDEKRLAALMLTESGLVARVDAHDRAFVERESGRFESYFRTVEKAPLSREQIEACLCFEDRVLTVAAAGSGKTSTLIAKAGYSLLRGLVSPDEILLLAFNADAARGMRQRVAARLGPLSIGAERIRAETFHKLGLEIIGKATGRKPSVAPWVTDGGDVETIAEIIDHLCSEDLAFRAMAGLFRLVLSRDLSAFEEDPDPDFWEGSTNRLGFRTARGEMVKSQEERLIADWSFYNGVNYEYERSYEIDTATADHRQYTPDFYYPDAKLYHEHFALDQSGRPPERFEASYLEGVEWKRSVHRVNGTDLIETTSFGLRQGDDLDRLRTALESRGVVFNPDSDRSIPGREPPSNLEIARKFRVFLIHAKNNRLSVDDLRVRLAASPGRGLRIRQSVFLSLFERISAEWDRRLREGGYVDFEDMLSLATDLVASGRWESPFRLIMVDEFQDVSHSRAALVETLALGEGRLLFAVGDDWQAINRFAGADISIMSRFEESFGEARRLTLSETFRAPQDLCDIAGEFVARNPAQIRKRVVSSQPGFGAPVQVCFCDDASREGLLEKHLQALYDKVGTSEHPARADGTVTALMLGRYNRDAPARLRQWRDSYGDRIRIEFMTIHSSKGLEADYVFLVRMSSGWFSFPSTIEDDPILLLAMPDSDGFRFAEERRLFYVALTRARRKVVIYCDERTPSTFIEELQSDERVVFVGKNERRCPACRRGTLTRRSGPYSEFLGCSGFPRCRHTEPLEGLARPTLRRGAASGEEPSPAELAQIGSEPPGE